MVANLVLRFRTIQGRLNDQIENYDSPEFHDLDQQIVDTFEAIHAFVPETPADTRTLVAFYLEMIAANDGGDNSRLIDRVQSLLDTLPLCQSGNRNVDGGDGI